MKKHFVFLTSLICITSLWGCATARVVTVQPKKGGVIAVMPAQDLEAREKANALMAGNCGAGKYEITEEGEVVVGVTHSSAEWLHGHEQHAERHGVAPHLQV